MGPPTGPGARSAPRADDDVASARSERARGAGRGADDIGPGLYDLDPPAGGADAPHDDPSHPAHPRHPRVARARRRFRRMVARVRLVRARVRRTPAGRLGWRIGVGVVGGVLLVAGIIMIPGPGQGWATVFLALAILSTEFSWARRMRHGLWVRLVQARRHWSRSSRRKKLVLGAAVVLVAAAALVLALWGGLVVTGLPAWLPGPVAETVGEVPGVE